jgi:ABC-type amino acid transport substrate-binding protein
MFDPPLSFEMTSVPFGGERDPLDEFLLPGNFDFVFSNAAVLSCMDSEAGVNSLVTNINRRKVRNQTFPVTEMGGVFFTTADNDEVNDLQDLKDKRLGMGSMSALGAYVVQVDKLFAFLLWFCLGLLTHT